MIPVSCGSAKVITTAAETSAGFTDQDWFEFVELTNISDSVTLDLGGRQMYGAVGLTRKLAHEQNAELELLSALFHRHASQSAAF